jgi:hypothetical protein
MRRGNPLHRVEGPITNKRFVLTDHVYQQLTIFVSIATSLGTIYKQQNLIFKRKTYTRVRRVNIREIRVIRG